MRNLRLAMTCGLLAVQLVLGLADIGYTVERLFDSATIEMGVFEEGRDYSLEIRLPNISGRKLEIISIVSSCGCTEVSTPSPTVEPGGELVLLISMDTSGKFGSFVKIVDIEVQHEAEPFELKLIGSVRHSESGSAPGALFRGKCASCHLPPTLDKKDAQALYDSLCYMCHKGNLLAVVNSSDNRHVRSAIADGVHGTSMPGFAKKNHGPLSDGQIDSIMDYIIHSKRNDKAQMK